MIAIIVGMILGIVDAGIFFGDTDGDTLDIQVGLTVAIIVLFTLAALTGPLV